MTANVWGDYFQNPVDVREGAFIDAFARYRPDIIGLQEMTPGWYDGKMFSSLQDGYAITGAVLGSHVNYVPLAYDKARFDLLESGFQRYSKTPDRSKGITYAVLQAKENRQVFAVCNTHFWWKSGPEHDRIRHLNATELILCMRRLKQVYSCPVFAFGDLNCTIADEVFQVFNASNIVRLHDIAQSACPLSSHHADPTPGADGLYHGHRTDNPQSLSIDHILGLFGAQPCDVSAYELVLDQPVLDASDHSPVYADIDV